nr:hypothetical protein [Tanacetum cinerariifolium]
MDSVEKAIVKRGLYKKAHDSKVNERTTQTQEEMVNMVKDKLDENEDPEEDKFEEEEDPKEEEDDMEIDIEENKNEPEITYLYVEMDPLNPLLLSLNLMMRSRLRT